MRAANNPRRKTHPNSWETGYRLAQQFAKENSHANVSCRHIDDGFNLGAWVTTQRAAHRNGRLSKERKVALEKLPGWVWDVHEKKWQQGFAHLKKYARLHGSIDVPQLARFDGFGLGDWIKSQQDAYQKGVLTKERQDALESTPAWTWKGKCKIAGGVSREWLESYARLKEYVKREGHAYVPSKYKTERWV
jgi:hypothetical protein